MQIGLIKGLLNVQVDGSRNLLNPLQQFIRVRPVGLQIVTYNLHINGSGKAEVQNLADDVGRQKREGRPGKLLGKLQAEIVHVVGCRPVILGQADENVRICRSNGSGVAIRKIDAAIGQTDVVDDAVDFLRRDLLADRSLNQISQSGCLLNTSSRTRAQMQFELTCIDRGEKILTQPRNQKRKRS